MSRLLSPENWRGKPGGTVGRIIMTALALQGAVPDRQGVVPRREQFPDLNRGPSIATGQTREGVYVVDDGRNTTFILGEGESSSFKPENVLDSALKSLQEVLREERGAFGDFLKKAGREIKNHPELLAQLENQQAQNLIVVEIPREQRLLLLTKILNSKDSGGLFTLVRLLNTNGNLFYSDHPVIIEQTLAQFLTQPSYSPEGKVISPVRLEQTDAYQLVRVNKGKSPQEVARRYGWTPGTVFNLNSSVLAPEIPSKQEKNIILPKDDGTRWIITGGLESITTMSPEEATIKTKNTLEKYGALNSQSVLGVFLGTSGLGTEKSPVLLARPSLKDYNRKTHSWTPVEDEQGQFCYAGLLEEETLHKITLDRTRGEKAEIYQGKEFPGPALVIKDWWGNQRWVNLKTGEVYEWGKWPEPTATLKPPTPTKPRPTRTPRPTETTKPPEVTLPEIIYRIPPFPSNITIHTPGYWPGIPWGEVDSTEPGMNAHSWRGIFEGQIGIDSQGKVNLLVDLDVGEGQNLRKVELPTNSMPTIFSIDRTQQGETEIYRTTDPKEVAAILSLPNWFKPGAGEPILISIWRDVAGKPPQIRIKALRTSMQGW